MNDTTNIGTSPVPSIAQLDLQLRRGVSVIVCCYNSEAVLPQTLKHLARQVVPSGLDWEVVLVDNASTDQTSAIAKAAWQTLGSTTPLRILLEETPGLSDARRCGAMAAQYRLLIFCDDDNWLNKDYIAKAAELMQDPTIGIGGGLGTAVSDVPLPDWFEKHQRSYAVGPQGSKAGTVESHLYGAGFVMRTAVLQHAYRAGFRSLLSDRKGNQLSSGGDGEIAEWVSMLGYDKWVYQPEMTFEHFISETRLDTNVLASLRKGFGRASPIIRMYAKLRKKQLNRFSRRWSWRVSHSFAATLVLTVHALRAGTGKLAFDSQKEALLWLAGSRKRYYRTLARIEEMRRWSAQQIRLADESEAPVDRSTSMDPIQFTNVPTKRQLEEL